MIRILLLGQDQICPLRVISGFLTEKLACKAQISFTTLRDRTFLRIFARKVKKLRLPRYCYIFVEVNRIVFHSGVVSLLRHCMQAFLCDEEEHDCSLSHAVCTLR